VEGAAADQSLSKPDAFIIGYLSNVTFDKGIREYFGTLKRLWDLGYDVRGLIAGPAASEEVRQYIEMAVRESNGRASWLGAVHGEAKFVFLRRLAVFLFPTDYVNEAQPNVLFEALQFGIPTVSTRRGCIGEDLEGDGVLAVPVVDRFVDDAVPFIVELYGLYKADRLEALRMKVQENFHQRRKEAVAREREFMSRVLGTSVQLQTAESQTS
jgi:glycosyltransferase involved in cell wall biosynthesis